jgi:serine/threonine protein kinase
MSSPGTQPPVLPEMFGPYRIVRPLGKGGMGAVYLARDTRLDRDVAIKVCTIVENPTALERFRREAKAAAGLAHTNLCPVYEFDVRDGVAYLTMAFVEGPTLSHWVKQRGKLSQRDAARLVAKLAIAMDVAHDAGVIHRDLKPSNVVINKKNEPVILDFGLARQMDDASTRLTQQGAIYGTPSYMAPEQAGGDPEKIGPAADIYSLGVILYELLTGRVPFEGTFTSVIGQLLTNAPTPIRQLNPAVDPALEAICLRALNKNPKDRPPNMKEFARLLAKLAPSLSGAAVAVPDASAMAATKATAATSPAPPRRDESATRKASGPPLPDYIPLPLNDAAEIVQLPLTPSKAPPPLPPRRRDDTHRDRPRRQPAPTNALPWIIGGIVAGVMLIALVVVLIVVLRKGDSDSDSGSGSSSSSGDSSPSLSMAANRTRSQNNLKQIGLAMHNYHQTYGTFPPASLPPSAFPGDKAAQPLYSWRVAILPFIEEDPLFAQWNRNERWDGPSNSALHTRMPKLYQLPGKSDTTQTYYQVFVGNGTAFGPGGGVRMTDIKDGTSNTILVVESSTPVLWCAPYDIPFVESVNGLNPSLYGGHFGKSVNVLMADGTCRIISHSFSPFEFQNAVLIADGQLINWPD